MNTSTSSATGTSHVAVLKKKMLDTKEEVEKVKEQIQDMNMQVLIQFSLEALLPFFFRLKLSVGSLPC